MEQDFRDLDRQVRERITGREGVLRTLQQQLTSIEERLATANNELQRAGEEAAVNTDKRRTADGLLAGFGILNLLRAALPDARSFLMDRPTLEAHRSLWVQEPSEHR